MHALYACTLPHQAIDYPNPNPLQYSKIPTPRMAFTVSTCKAITITPTLTTCIHSIQYKKQTHQNQPNSNSHGRATTKHNSRRRLTTQRATSRIGSRRSSSPVISRQQISRAERCSEERSRLESSERCDESARDRVREQRC